MIYIPSFIKIGPDIPKFVRRETHTDTKRAKRSRKLIFFQNKVSIFKTFSSAKNNDSFRIFQNVCFKRVIHIYV
jgi:hypothetical protein